MGPEMLTSLHYLSDGTIRLASRSVWVVQSPFTRQLSGLQRCAISLFVWHNESSVHFCEKENERFA